MDPAGGTAARARPVPPLRGPTVHLRAWERDDLPLRARWLSDARVLSMLAEGAPLGADDAERWFARIGADQGNAWFRFVICRRADDRPVGSAWFGPVDWVQGTAEIGIYVGEPEDWGKGIGTEAMGILLDLGFGWLRLERMWLRVLARNERALRSYRRAGFVEEGVERGAMLIEGRREDVVLMAILRDEWHALARPKAWEVEPPG
jgi:RimJ/RimL family protein N-acetyltransferase